MIGVNPPGNFLWDAKTTDEQIAPLLRALREGRRPAASGRTTSPPRCTTTAATCPTAGCFLPIKKGNVRIASFFGLMESTSDGGAALRADDARHAGSRRRRATRAGSGSMSLLGRPGVPEVVRLGPDAPPSARADAAVAQRLLRLGRASHGSILGEPGHRLRLGRRAAGRRLAGRAATRTSTAACGRRTWRRSSSAAALDFATPPQVATKELLPYLPNGHQVVLPGLGHTDQLLDVRSLRPAAA